MPKTKKTPKEIGKLARKRKNCPFARGTARVWAAGVVHAVGWVNFLFDRTQDPDMTTADLCERSGVSKASVQAKSRQIRKLLDVIPMEPEYSLPSRLKDNPLAWLVEVDGFILDARMLPQHVQEAKRRGLVPNLAL